MAGSGWGQDLVPMCCEYGNKTSNSMKGDLLENYSKESALWNQNSKIR